MVPVAIQALSSPKRNYWVDLFTAETWKEFHEAGGTVSGFSESRWNTVQKMSIGDYLLCYLTGVSRWIGILEVTSAAFKDRKEIWKGSEFPCRVGVKVVAALTPETAIPVLEMRDRLSIFENLKSPSAWTGYFRSSPNKWKLADGEAVVQAVLAAKQDPVIRPVDPSKLKYRPKAFKAKIGLVTVPDSEPSPEEPLSADTSKEPTAHSEIQSLLLQLGSEMGYDVWVARNDRGKIVEGKRLVDLPRMITALPLQFDEATNKTIELIGVLWLNKNAIVAAFEIESTTSIYSGLLRMADLIAMQPNLNLPLYLVAPEERREKVFNEVNRPTFSRLSPKLVDVCRYVAFETLREKLRQVQSVIRYLKPEFLGELSENCSVD